MKKFVSILIVLLVAVSAIFAGGSSEAGTEVVNITDDFGDTVGKGISFYAKHSTIDLYSGQNDGYDVTLTCFSDGVFVKVNYYNYDGSPIEANYTNYEAKIKAGDKTYTETLYQNTTMNEYGYSFINNSSLSDAIVNAIANGETVKLSIKGDSYRKNVLLAYNLEICSVSEITDRDTLETIDVTMDRINEYLNQ